MNQAAQYSNQGTQDVAVFLDNVSDLHAETKGTGEFGTKVLDAVANQSGVNLPKHLQSIMDSTVETGHAKVLDSIAEGISAYKAAHGVEPTADLVEAALQQGAAALQSKDTVTGVILDSAALNTATSGFHDPQSLQPNRAVVAILSAFTEAIPFAGYLPVDIGSNEGKLAILSHRANSTYGDYADGAIMDGVNVGDVYASSSRFVKFNISGTAPFSSKFSATNLAADKGYCNPNGTGIPVLRGRTIVYVNGLKAATDAFSGTAASNPINGSIAIAGTSYAITGTVNVTTGAISITPAPALPAGTIVTAEAFVDYETSPALIPVLGVQADTYALFANPWRITTRLSIDAQGQMQNELNLDANSEALVAIRNQMAMERHYKALRLAKALGANNAAAFDFEWATRSTQLQRAQIFQDLQAKFYAVDQQMANLTMDHGITHCYVGKTLAGILTSLPNEFWQSSGVPARAGIYRLGRLFGKYECYYDPKVAYESADGKTAEIIAVGRSNQVARNPIILGDAIAPTFLDLNMQDDLKRRSAIYARDFTAVNPHEASAMGCAVITLNNLG